MAEPTSVGKGTGFVRTRRITGYLARVERFNVAKQAEVRDRVKHVTCGCEEAAKLADK